MNVLRIDSANL